MQITIHDEAARRAVLFAVLRRAANEISESFYDELANEADAVISLPTDLRPGVLVSHGLTLISATLLDLEEVKRAAIGTAVCVSMPANQLRDALEACMATITGDEGFFRAAQPVREQILAIHDAAERLLLKLPKPAEAVA